MNVLPVARTESLIVKEVDGETLVYDLTSDKAHCLNDTAARVWKNCDGRKTVSEISEVLSLETNASIKEDVVWMALDQLAKYKLMGEMPLPPARLAKMSRRHLVGVLGVAAMLLPMVTTIVAPTAALAASFGPCCTPVTVCPPGTTCNSSEHAPCGKTCN